MQFRLLNCLFLMAALFTGPVCAEWGGKGSFSPIAMPGDNGKPLKLTWAYRVNQGKPLYLNEVVQGLQIHLRLQPGDLLVSINPNTLKRTVTLSATVSGSATGQITMRITENLAANTEGKTLITEQKLKLNGNLAIQGVGVSVVANMLTQLSPASEWFLDRNDLDLLAIGTIYDEQGAVSADVQGNVCASAVGRKQCQDLSVSELSSPEQWEIMGKSEQLKVKNVMYTNIVEVNRNTLVPAFEGLLNGGPNTEPATITYWVAKGVGMVKGVGQYRFLGKPLSIELKRTAIALPKIIKLKSVPSGSEMLLNIAGKGFGKTSGKILLGEQEVDVVSWKNTAVVAKLPAGLNPGTYDVKVERENGIESIARQIDLAM